MNGVTVVIPAYNAARCIGRAVKSLLAQTIPVYIIVVNDGSTDETETIAAKLGVRVITQKNAGAYSARIAGVKLVTTPYVGFMDADDFAHPDMYEKLLAFAKEHDLDIAQCDYRGKSGASAREREELFLTEQDIVDKIIQPRFIRGDDAVHVWDKLYRCEMVRDFEPSKIMMFEDLAVNAQAFSRARRVGYLHDILYDYDVNEGSSVRNFRLRNVEDLKEAIRFRRKYFTKYGVNPDSVAHAQWICRNVRNMYIVACSAPIRDDVTRIEKVDALLNLDEVKAAFVQCGLSLRWRMMHSALIALIINFMKRFQSMLRK